MTPAPLLVAQRAITNTLLALALSIRATPPVDASAATACRPASGYRAPVSAPVSDPFRAPSSPFGPGNRGLEYATQPGSDVTAIGPGVVVFAGRVGGRLFVTVRHADGLRSSYAYLAAVAVRAGDAVTRGTRLGRAGAVFHLGIRCGDAYVDPAPLLDRGRHARLVPDDRFPAR